MSKLNIRPAGMTLERAMEIATDCLPAPVPPGRPVAARVAELHGQGMADAEIADAIGVPRGAVRKARGRLGLKSHHTLSLASGKCKNGHEWTAENTYTGPSGHKRCRQCARDSERRKKARPVKTTNQKADNA